MADNKKKEKDTPDWYRNIRLANGGPFILGKVYRLLPKWLNRHFQDYISTGGCRDFSINMGIFRHGANLCILKKYRIGG